MRMKNLKRLSENSGAVLEAEDVTASDDKLVRPCVLVHAGAEGEKIEFMSGDGSISFDEARIKRVIANQNKELEDLAKQYGGLDKMPPGAWTPILDSHEDSSNSRVVGRLQSLLRFEVRDVPKIGKNVPCAVADIAFLGKDTVTRVKDGRIYHLSIGIDEKTDTLGEISTVVEPAAPGAMVLNKGKGVSKKLKQGEPQMGDKLKRLQAIANRVSKMKSFQKELTAMSSKLVAASDSVKLTARKGEVTHRLTGLMRSGKMTPAEFKKLDLVKLSALAPEHFDTIVGSFDVREPVISPGQKGSTDAAAFSELGKGMEKRQLKNLKGEVYKDFKRLGKKLAAADEFEKEEKESKMAGGPVNPGKDPHAVPGEEEQHLAEVQKHMAHLGKCLESGDISGAKEAHKALAEKTMGGQKHMEAGAAGDVKSEDYKKSMDAMQGQVDELNTQMARMAGMVKEMMGAEEEEGKELEAEEEEEPAAAAS